MRFAALDGWRGLCALLVCLYHFNVVVMWWLRAEPLLLHSFLFVDFFFVLSGFVISHSYAARISDRQALARFMLRRFGRLWPLHLAVLTGWLVLEFAALAARPFVGHFSVNEPFTGPNSLPALLANLLLLQSFGLFDLLTWNGPSWSIAAEFWAYLLFGLFCLSPGRRSSMALLLAAIGAGTMALLSPRLMDATYDYGFFRCVYGFFLGHLIYELRTHGAIGERILRHHGNNLEAAVLLLVGFFVYGAGRNPLSFGAPLVFALVVYIFSFEAGFLSRILARPPFRQLGRWSYSIYMVHALLVQILIYAVRLAERSTGARLGVRALGDHGETYVIWLGSDYAMAVLALAYVAAVLVTASITYRMVEEPARLYFNALASRKAAASADPTSPAAEELASAGLATAAVIPRRHQT